MKSSKLGSRYKYYSRYYKKSYVGAPYDYKTIDLGILRRTMSSTIISASENNKVFKGILEVFENSIEFVLDYIEKLKNFKNFTKYNR